MSQVFISYSRKDEAQAGYLVARLTKDGISTWIDTAEIGTGLQWMEEIARAIKSCTVLALLVSEDSVESEKVVKEVSFALQQNKKILPLYLEPTVIPPALELPLAGLQYLELYGKPQEEIYEKILKALDRLGVAAPIVSSSGNIDHGTLGKKKAWYDTVIDLLVERD